MRVVHIWKRIHELGSLTSDTTYTRKLIYLFFLCIHQCHMKYIVQRQLTVTNAIKQNEWVCRLRVRLDQTVSSIIELPKSGKSILRSKNTHTINNLMVTKWNNTKAYVTWKIHELYTSVCCWRCESNGKWFYIQEAKRKDGIAEWQ